MLSNKYSLTTNVCLARPLWRVPFLPHQITVVRGTSMLAVAGSFMHHGEHSIPYSIDQPMLVILHADTGELLRAYQLHRSVVHLRDMGDGRHLVGTLFDGSVHCWDLRQLREVTEERFITNRRPLIDIVFCNGGKPVARVIPEKHRTVLAKKAKVMIGDKVVYKLRDAEFLSLSPDGQFVAAYSGPNRFVIFDVSNPTAHRWVGTPRAGRARCCWLPGTHRLVVASDEGEWLRNLRAIFHKAIVRARSNEKPFVEQDWDTVGSRWVRCYEVQVRNSVMAIDCVWELSLADIHDCPKAVVCDGKQILIIFCDSLVRLSLDGSIIECQPFYQSVSAVSEPDENGRVWLATLDGNIVTVDEAVKSRSFGHQQWPIYQLAWTGSSILWASNASYRDYSYALSAYDVPSRRKIAEWKVPRQEGQKGPVSIYLQEGLDGQSVYVASVGEHGASVIEVYQATISDEQLLPLARLCCADLRHDWIGSVNLVSLFSVNGGIELLAIQALSKSESQVDTSMTRLVWWHIAKEGKVRRKAHFGPSIGLYSLNRICAVYPIAGQQKLLALLELEDVRHRPYEVYALAVLESNGTVSVVCQTNTEGWDYCRVLAAVGGASAVLGMADERILCVDLKTARYRWKVDVESGVSCLSPGTSHELIAAGLQNGVLELRDMDNGTLIERRQLHLGPINAVAWGPGGQLATAGADGKIIISTVATSR